MVDVDRWRRGSRRGNGGPAARLLSTITVETTPKMEKMVPPSMIALRAAAKTSASRVVPGGRVASLKCTAYSDNGSRLQGIQGTYTL